MELLSPKKANKLVVSQRDKQAREGLEISNLLKRGNKKLQDIDKLYKEKAEKYESDFIDFSKEIADKKKTLEAEVADLENRREQALIPITNETLLLAKKIEEFKRSEDELLALQEELRERQVELENLSDKNKADRKEIESIIKYLDDKEARLKEDSKTIAQDIKKLVVEKERFKDLKNNEEREIKRLKSDYKTQLDILNKREKYLDDKENKLNKEQQHLYSQQQALKAAFAEAKKKGIKL